MPTNLTRHACNYCSKDYASSGGLRQHIDSKHWKELGLLPKYVCIFCERPHECKSNLNRHYLSCKKNPDRINVCDGEFKCDKCPRAFKQKGGLKQHMDKQHSNVCDSCDDMPKTIQ